MNQMIKMLSKSGQKYKINNLELQGQYVFKDSNLYSIFTIDTIQISVSNFMKISHKLLVEVFSYKKPLVLNTLSYIDQKKLNQKIILLFNNLLKSLKLNFLIFSQFPDNLYFVVKKMASI